MTGTNEKATMSVEIARELLRHVMEWDSEESCCAGWIDGNEFRLWCQVVRDPVVAGEVVDLPEYRWLRELAAIAGGWWVWPSEPGPDERPAFRRMSEWLPMYEERRQELIEKYGPRGWAAALPLEREKTRAFWETFAQNREIFGVAAKPTGMKRETAAALLLRLMVEEVGDQLGLQLGA